jgi:hypothetical protein
MKPRIAVTDACIFIDLCDIGLVASFFELELEVHTSSAVLYELYPEQQQALRAYQSTGRLLVHNMQEQDFVAIHASEFPKALSEADKSVLYIANMLGAMMLSSDKALRKCAKNRAIEYHGMLWILDKLVENSIIAHKEAADKLKTLLAINMVFQNNQSLQTEIEKRLKTWL